MEPAAGWSHGEKDGNLEIHCLVCLLKYEYPHTQVNGKWKKKYSVLCWWHCTYSRQRGFFKRLPYNFHLSCLKFNMKISIHKTKAMTISKEPLCCKLEIDGRIVEQVMEFNYLRVNITSSGNLVKEKPKLKKQEEWLAVWMILSRETKGRKQNKKYTRQLYTRLWDTH